MTPSVTIAPLIAANLDEMTALYVATFNAAPWLDAWTDATARARLADFLHAPGVTALSAHLPDGELAGFVLGSRKQWYTGVHFNLRELCVALAWQRRGIGTRLVQTLENLLRADSVERVYLLTAREGQAAAFYQRLGYYISPKMALLAHQL
jgi:aminoglycoside 6'-N-acetyltransferase I